MTLASIFHFQEPTKEEQMQTLQNKVSDQWSLIIYTVQDMKTGLCLCATLASISKPANQFLLFF